ncbi:hypothetical protein AAE478_001128 [Parahypoxylon ruwenzoriense]
MRFEDWDVLLFPRDCKIPIKEFKTNCHVVHDTEFAYSHGSFGLPTMTCFMPGLSPGTQFNISLHCWKTPDVSQFTRNYSKHPELVKFEARVLVDGRLIASSSFNRTGPWPQLINHSFEFTKNGDLETLRFPTFRSEMLRQSYWSPADEVGRIKIIISEGFPRDSLTVPIERVKNIVAFSFQHAPLDILESSGIAWPNPSMWRRSPFNPTMPAPSSQRHEAGPEAHLHSPRRRSSYAKATSGSSGFGSGPPGLAQVHANSLLPSMPNTQSLLQRSLAGSSSGFADPFNTQKSDATAYFDISNGFGSGGYGHPVESSKSNYNPTSSRKITGTGKVSRSDASMPDFGLGGSTNAQGMSDSQFMNFPGSNICDTDISIHDPKAPTNTPTTMVGPNFIDDLGIDMSKVGTPGSMSARHLSALVAFHQARGNADILGEADKHSTTDTSMNEFLNSSNTNFSSEFATSLTHSLLNQPHPLPVQAASVPPSALENKSRKETRLNQESPNGTTICADHIEMCNISQSSFSNLDKENQDTSENNSPPSQGAFSGIFSHRSTSTGDFGNELTNVANVFPHSMIDSYTGSDENVSIHVMSGPEKGVKRSRHFTPAGSKVIDNSDEALIRSPRVPVGLDDQFLESI